MYWEQTAPESLSNPNKAFKVGPAERKDAYVEKTPESKGYNPFDDNPDPACHDAGGPSCTGVVHHISGWDARKIPCEQGRQSAPIRALGDVLSCQITHAKQRDQYSSKRCFLIEKKRKLNEGKKFVLQPEEIRGEGHHRYADCGVPTNVPRCNWPAGIPLRAGWV